MAISNSRFAIQEWRRMYDRVHEIGKLLTDSCAKLRDNGDYDEPKHQLSYVVQRELEKEMKKITSQSGAYLDQHNMKMPLPLWDYDSTDPTTHASHGSFKYGHLLAFPDNMSR